MSKSRVRQRTRLIRVVGVVNDFLDGKASSTGTGKYKVWSTGEELHSSGTCIAMWQRPGRGGHRVLVEAGKGPRTEEQCKDVLRWVASHRSISHVNV